MTGTVEPYLKREFQEISLLTMALCRAPNIFPVDQRSLQSLVNRMNQKRAGSDSSQILVGAPSVSPHSSDELWVWLFPGVDHSIELIAFQGVEQARVTAQINATGKMGPLVAEGTCRSLSDGDEDENAASTRAAEDMLFSAALVILASPEGVPRVPTFLTALGDSIRKKLEVSVMFVEEPGVNDEGGPQLGSRQSAEEILEIGPLDGVFLHLRASVRGRKCSAWLSNAGRLMDLGLDIVMRSDSD